MLYQLMREALTSEELDKIRYAVTDSKEKEVVKLQFLSQLGMTSLILFVFCKVISYIFHFVREIFKGNFSHIFSSGQIVGICQIID